MSTRESDIQALVMVALSQEFGAIVTHVQAGEWELKKGGYIKGAASGTADLLAGVPHRGSLMYVAIEVKTPDGRQSPAQKKFQAAVTKRGGVYLLVRSPQDAVAQVRAALDAA